MTPSQACYDLIKSFESLSLTAYPDPATGRSPWTIGYGHTGPEVKEGLEWTLEQSKATLIADVLKSSSGVDNLLPNHVSQPQFDALVSFAYNVGLENLKRSTLMMKVNRQDYFGALQQFLYWVNANGKQMRGLANRRLAESQLFLTGIYSDHLGQFPS